MTSLTDLKTLEISLQTQLEEVRTQIAMLETPSSAKDANTDSPTLSKTDSMGVIVDSEGSAAAETVADAATPSADSASPSDETPFPSETSEPDHEGDVDSKIAAWKDAGNKGFSAQDYAVAIKCYTRCIKCIQKLDREEEKAFCAIFANRSAANLAIKKWVAASWDAQCAAKCDPTFWKAHWRHGVSLMAMAPRIERSQNAVNAFETTLKLCPDEKKEEVTMALERAKIRLQEGKDRTPMPPQCAQS
jgi:hypothetical protein